MEAPRRDGASTRSLTAGIARRVRALRTEARLSGPGLATAMNGQGIPWNRTTVAKLETGRRESISVAELLALAVVLGVPPAWLLVDPKAGTPVPVAEGIEVDPWTALLWLTGSQPLEEPAGEAWASAQGALRPLVALAKLLESYRLIQRVCAGDVVVSSDPAESRRDWEDAEARTLQSIANQLGQFRALDLPAPQVPADVRKRAAELNIELPDQKEIAP
ncbi:MAG: helix-turn-helix domain-containing protein [Pseudonocardiaceae bacterium]